VEQEARDGGAVLLQGAEGGSHAVKGGGLPAELDVVPSQSVLRDILLTQGQRNIAYR
jgi:hypothetical protein